MKAFNTYPVTRQMTMKDVCGTVMLKRLIGYMSDAQCCIYSRDVNFGFFQKSIIILKKSIFSIIKFGVAISLCPVTCRAPRTRCAVTVS